MSLALATIPPRRIRSFSSSLSTGAFASPQKMMRAPAFASRSLRFNKSLSIAAALCRIVAISSGASGSWRKKRPTTFGSGCNGFLTAESVATRTVFPAGGKSARRAPPASIVMITSKAHIAETRGTRREMVHSSHNAFPVEAVHPIRNVTPRKPVTERI